MPEIKAKNFKIYLYMQILKKLDTYSKYAILIVLCCFIYGCGKGSPPDPPKGRSELVLEIFDLLQKKDHEVALKKIGRLRDLNQTNVFLANLEISERNNMIICMAQEEINKGDLPKALERITDGIKKYGRHNDLMVAQQKLTIAARIEEILEMFKAPRDSKHLRSSAIQLKEIGTKYKPAAPFIPIAKNKIKLAAKMDKWETKRAIDGLCSYIDTMIDEDDPDTKLLFAVLEVSDPYHTTVLNYLDYLKGNENLSLKTYEDDEDLFSSDFQNDGADMDDPEVTDRKGEVKKDETKVDNKTEIKIEEDKSEEKKKGWWNKFTF